MRVLFLSKTSTVNQSLKQAQRPTVAADDERQWDFQNPLYEKGWKSMTDQPLSGQSNWWADKASNVASLLHTTVQLFILNKSIIDGTTDSQTLSWREERGCILKWRYQREIRKIKMKFTTKMIEVGCKIPGPMREDRYEKSHHERLTVSA